MRFKVGDRVMATNDLTLAKKGDTGTIVKVAGSGDLIINWDRVVGRLKIYGIPYGHGEYVISDDNKRKLKNITTSTTYELHIMCKDGVMTNCVYKENGKIVNKSSTRRNVKEDKFDFKEAVKNCIERIGLGETDKNNPLVNDLHSENLVGKRFKKGQRVRVLNTEKHTHGKYKNLDLYIGESGCFRDDGEFKTNNYVSQIEFDNPILNKIDKRNGTLQWNWSEVELID